MFGQIDIRHGAKVQEFYRKGRWTLPTPLDDDIEEIWLRIKQITPKNGISTIKWQPHHFGVNTVKSAWDTVRKKKNKVIWFKLVLGGWLLPTTFLYFLACYTGEIACEGKASQMADDSRS